SVPTGRASCWFGRVGVYSATRGLERSYEDRPPARRSGIRPRSHTDRFYCIRWPCSGWRHLSSRSHCWTCELDRPGAPPRRVRSRDPASGPTCATLMAYPETSLPGGYRLAPSLAETEPVVSRDGRTYTFTVRKDARFSTGAPVTARAFSHALERIL